MSDYVVTMYCDNCQKLACENAALKAFVAEVYTTARCEAFTDRYDWEGRAAKLLDITDAEKEAGC